MQYTVFAHDPSASVGVANYENLGQMLIKSGIQVENYFIRLEVIKRIKDIIISKSETPEIKEMLKIIKILAFDMQNVAEHNEARVY
jgi:Ser-tRNA(Ala) deacylase AlaX